MDRQSVEANLEIFPNVETNYIWIDDKTLKIEIDEELEKDIDFFVNISKKATNLL
jgi:hypothetical protein